MKEGMRRGFKIAAMVLAMTVLAVVTASAQQRYRSERKVIRGGMEQKAGGLSQEGADSLAAVGGDSLAMATDSLAMAADSLTLFAADSLAAVRPDSLAALHPDSLAVVDGLPQYPVRDSLLAAAVSDSLTTAAADSLAGGKKRRREGDEKRFSLDSMSLPQMCWISAVLPGFGQVYNKQYWKLPILYSTLGASLGMFIYENNKYKPLKRQFDAITNEGLSRTEELDRLQTDMIRSNTRREIYMAAALASYVYFLGDAAVKYSTNDVSSVQRATTLAIICPSAGQIYNKSYWRVPIVLGGLATTVYCIDWNNRGYQRFKKAYRLRADYDSNPGDYPNGSTDEFGGRYSATFLKNLRDSYRRNRDLCIILTAGLYILQIVDAHVDAHLRDFDISDDLAFNVTPMVDYAYQPSLGHGGPTFGMNFSINF